MNFEEIGIKRIDEYEPVDLEIVGWKAIISKKTGKSHQIVECLLPTGQKIGLFDWGCQIREGKLWVLKKHMASAVQTATQ